MESTQKEAEKWRREDRCSYTLKLGNSEILSVTCDRGTVCLYFHMAHGGIAPSGCEESVIYRRGSGDIETCISTYKNTPEGRFYTDQKGVEPFRILANKDNFLTVEGLAPKDKNLVGLVLKMVQQEF